jgi:hypothetical protein
MVAAGLFPERADLAATHIRLLENRIQKQPHRRKNLIFCALLAHFDIVEYSSLSSISKRIGKRTWKVDPHPVSLSAQILPL